MLSRPPKVSVDMVTYNQVQFVAQAVESVLMQRVSFSYELVIADDCSTDGTATILRDYAERFPDRVRLIVREKNLGAGPNAVDLLKRLAGDYIAYLEGDDYWSDPDKLQRQVDYLDAHDGCALVHHRVARIAWPSGEVIDEWPPPRHRRERMEPQDLVTTNYIQSCSMMFRRTWLPPLDDEFQRLQVGDWPLCVLLSERGWLGYIDRTMAHYRMHPASGWNSRPPAHKLAALQGMAEYLAQRVGETSRERWHEMILALLVVDVVLALRTLNLGGAARSMTRLMKRSAAFGKVSWIFTGLWRFYRPILALSFDDLSPRLRALERAR
jgi:glycosyltransferase involved in cell wall biosynthesis